VSQAFTNTTLSGILFFMTSPETAPQPHYTSIYDLLYQVAVEAANLERDARSKLYEERDRAGHLLNLQKRAHLISGLPNTLESFKLSGGIVPDEVEDFARSYAGIANEALVSNGTFMLGTILNLAPGGLTTDPNDLERLAARFEPPQE
jgi:hypothetical protein